MVDCIEYGKRKLHEAYLHEDTYAVHSTIICIVLDSVVGRLHIPEFDIPESLTAGGVVILDPNTIHEVSSSIRQRDRRVLTDYSNRGIVKSNGRSCCPSVKTARTCMENKCDNDVELFLLLQLISSTLSCLFNLF